APDIAQYNPGAMRSLIPAGLIYNLDPYSQAYGWEGEFPESSLAPLTSNEEATKFDTGSLYAAPGGLSILGVFYNKELLEEAGLEAGAGQLWSAWGNVLGDVQDYKDWVYGADGASIETDGALQAAQQIVDGVESGYIRQGASSVSDSDALADFADGNSLFLVTGNWSVSQLQESMGDNVGFFAFPGESADSEPVASGSSVAFSISSKTEYPNAAAAFLNYMGTAEAAQIQVDGGFMPVNTDADVQIGGLGDDVA